jgi:uncharacterized protein (UPF0332 family)
MSLADDLLDQARLLAEHGVGRPRQADLRRAISAAYYALFHRLIESSTTSIISGRAAQTSLARAFEHGPMKKVCTQFASPNFPNHLAAVVPPPTLDLRTVAEAFVELQEERHEADYNTGVAYTRAETRSLVQRAETAFAAWDRARTTSTAKVFLVALLVGDKWKR